MTPLSRQRKWQLAMVAQGKCALCAGVLSVFSKNLCRECLDRSRSRYKAKRRYTKMRDWPGMQARGLFTKPPIGVTQNLTGAPNQ